jgi:hypothetical protein
MTSQWKIPCHVTKCEPKNFEKSWACSNSFGFEIAIIDAKGKPDW